MINNYLPVLLLSICAKGFDEIIFNSLFKYVDNYNIWNKNQSGFSPVDSFLHELLSIIHDIYKTFDANPSLEVRGVFSALIKAFDRVWHEGWMYKLECVEICEEFYELMHSSLSGRHKRVVLNGRSLHCPHIVASVPQGFISRKVILIVY